MGHGVDPDLLRARPERRVRHTARGNGALLVVVDSKGPYWERSIVDEAVLVALEHFGTPYRLACRQTVSDCGCTPATPSKITTPPSNTRRDRCTSSVKSICPGVSMMLIW